MSRYLYPVFKKHLDIQILPKHAKQLRALLINFETRNDHPLTLNSQLINVYSLVFLPKDTQAIYDIFELDPKEVTEIQDSVTYIEHGHTLPVINRNFDVTGNTLNILITWLLHLIYNSKLSSSMKHQMLVDLLKLWQYKFFTSILSHIPYKSNEDVMRATINRLTKQSDIIRYGTWAKVMEAQSEKIASKRGIHLKTIAEYHNDQKVFYIISDTQSRVRDKVKNIISMFMATNDAGRKIASYSSTGTLDGEKVLINQVSTFDSMINNLSVEILNSDRFIDDQAISIICKIFTNLRSDMFRHLLNQYCELATSQSVSGELDKVEVKRKNELYLGTRVLITNIIQKSYRYLIKEQVDLKNKLAVVLKLKNIYSSSRIRDNELVMVKNSVSYFVDHYSKSQRTATNSTLKIAFVIYIILRTLRFT